MIPRTLEPEVMDTVAEAVDYDSMDHSTVNRVFVDDMLRFVHRSWSDQRATADAHVLDLGTGTAQIPLELLTTESSFMSVLACDLSAEMLKLANQNLRCRHLDHQILPVYCDCKCLPVAAESCAIVMSNSIVHHIPDPIQVFREMRRVVQRGGILFVRDLMRPDATEDVERFVQLYAGSENSHQQQMFRQSLHAALTVDEVAELLNRTGFSAESVLATSDRHWTVASVAA